MRSSHILTEIATELLPRWRSFLVGTASAVVATFVVIFVVVATTLLRVEGRLMGRRWPLSVAATILVGLLVRGRATIAWTMTASRLKMRSLFEVGVASTVPTLALAAVIVALASVVSGSAVAAMVGVLVAVAVVVGLLPLALRLEVLVFSGFHLEKKFC